MAKSKRGSKAAFVRKHPDLKPADLAMKAKEAGIDVTPGYVSNIRSSDKANGGVQKRGPGRKPGPAPKAGKSSGKTGLSKSGFIRSLPADMPAKDVVASAKAKGLNLTEAYVYAIRSAARKGSSKAIGLSKRRGPAPKVRAAGSVGPSGQPVKELLRMAIASAGIDGASRLLEDAIRRLQTIA